MNSSKKTLTAHAAAFVKRGELCAFFDPNHGEIIFEHFEDFANWFEWELKEGRQNHLLSQHFKANSSLLDIFPSSISKGALHNPPNYDSKSFVPPFFQDRSTYDYYINLEKKIQQKINTNESYPSEDDPDMIEYTKATKIIDSNYRKFIAIQELVQNSKHISKEDLEFYNQNKEKIEHEEYRKTKYFSQKINQRITRSQLKKRGKKIATVSLGLATYKKGANFNEIQKDLEKLEDSNKGREDLKDLYGAGFI